MTTPFLAPSELLQTALLPRTKVLITGATGNVGSEVIKALRSIEHRLDIFAAVRQPSDQDILLGGHQLRYAHFDFTDFSTHGAALAECDILFLLRPPNISDVGKYFAPIVESCMANGVKHIVFLSVQGVEKSRLIPHYKIEKLILESGIPYTFLRPAYFMQNFITTLRRDLVEKKRIFVPAGNAKFTLIDVRDVGAVAANVLADVSRHINAAYDLTSADKMTFGEMAQALTSNLHLDILFISPNLLRFFIEKRREHVPTMLILVMMMLHYLPRFQNEPRTTESVRSILNRPPASFEQFIMDNAVLLTA